MAHSQELTRNTDKGRQAAHIYLTSIRRYLVASNDHMEKARGMGQVASGECRRLASLAQPRARILSGIRQDRRQIHRCTF